jgi:hypothetical protein
MRKEGNKRMRRKQRTIRKETKKKERNEEKLRTQKNYKTVWKELILPLSLHYLTML